MATKTKNPSSCENGIRVKSETWKLSVLSIIKSECQSESEEKSEFKCSLSLTLSL